MCAGLRTPEETDPVLFSLSSDFQSVFSKYVHPCVLFEKMKNQVTSCNLKNVIFVIHNF